MTPEFVRKCNKLAAHFSKLDRGDLELALNKLQRENYAEYGFVLTCLVIGQNIGLASELRK